MSKLVIIPTQKEYDYFLASAKSEIHQFEQCSIGKVPVVRFPNIDIVVSCGGLGKVQFAIHTQYLIDQNPEWEFVICAGAAGALVDNLNIGDIVVATETVEHDIYNRFGPPLLPKFRGDETAVTHLKSLPLLNSFQIHFGPIASGDEDVIDIKRKNEIQKLTNGLAVAWEGAGGARACVFNDVPFIEMRGISDGADSTASSDFENNLESVINNIATLFLCWAKR
ncbi:MAG: acyltransferase [Chloroflexi bacterium]|nr:MAG: acyltransferase [Chloroflexota bacterium]